MIMQQLKPIEKRQLKRFSVRLKAYSQKTNKVLGYVVNLHTEGMMLMSKATLPENKEIKIWFGAGNRGELQNKISITVYRVWSSFTETIPRLYCTGLHYINPSDEALDKIKALTDDLGPQIVG
jgi:hypothetical protein